LQVDANATTERIGSHGLPRKDTEGIGAAIRGIAEHACERGEAPVGALRDPLTTCAWYSRSSMGMCQRSHCTLRMPDKPKSAYSGA